MQTPVYKNFLKGEYAVESGDTSLIITAISCYRLKEEVLGLIEYLPTRGNRDFFVHAIESMGIEKAEVVFDRLLAIGVLKIEKTRGLKDIAATILAPKFTFISAAWQEKFFNTLGLLPSRAWPARNISRMFLFVTVGMAVSLAVSYTGLHHVLEKVSSGEPETLHIFFLVLLGSVIHELGHSYAAAAAGIAFRPIGFSVYLFFPVFYANVSGMERSSLKERVAIDMGGFFSQSAYLIAILTLWCFTQHILFLETVRWMSLMIVFNMNPLIRTDIYWLYKDIRNDLPKSKLADWLHVVYLVAFLGFTLYLFQYLWRSSSNILVIAFSAWKNPASLLKGGYKLVLGIYLVFIFFTGGVQRLKEVRQEWLDLRKA